MVFLSHPGVLEFSPPLHVAFEHGGVPGQGSQFIIDAARYMPELPDASTMAGPKVGLGWALPHRLQQQHGGRRQLGVQRLLAQMDSACG